MMNNINSFSEKQFSLSVFGYNRRKVDEFVNELLTYCWNLEEENKELKNDLTIHNKTSHINHVSNAKWEEKEYSMLLGLPLQEDLLDYNGCLLYKKNTVITTQLIESLISKGLYGELVAAVDPSKGVTRNAR